MIRRSAVAGIVSGLLTLAGGAAAQGPAGLVQAHVALDNEQVRAALWTLPPGMASGRHMGLEPEMNIVVAGELTLVTDEGRRVFGPGEVAWVPSLVPHDARNEGERTLRLWVVLLKPPG